MFRFASSAWLAGFVLVPMLAALLVLAARSRRRALDRFGESELVARLTETVSVSARRAKAALVVFAVGLIVLALARPQFGATVETVRSRGQDIVVALDLSESMRAEDVSPNRLERSKLAIVRLMQRLDGDRIGLVGFAADAFVQIPLTTDYGAARMFLSAMDPEMMPVQGTDLGEALRVSLEALTDGGRESGVLIVITDGEDHEVGYGEQAAALRAAGARVYFVGIGSTEGVPIPVYDEAGDRTGFLRDDDGNVVTTRLDTRTLEAAAAEAGAEVIHAGPGGAEIDDLIGEIASAEGEELEERQVTRFEEQYQIFLVLALLLLMAEWLLPERARAREEWSGRFG